VGAQGEGAKFTGQLHLKLVLAAGALMKSGKQKSERLENAREVECQARIAALERRVAERDRSVASREPSSGERDKSKRLSETSRIPKKR
jgi:hypothetical protein